MRIALQHQAAHRRAALRQPGSGSGAQHRRTSARSTPLSQVPVLVITRAAGPPRTLTQSMAILEYLEERFPSPPLLPPPIPGCAGGPPARRDGERGDSTGAKPLALATAGRAGCRAEGDRAASHRARASRHRGARRRDGRDLPRRGRADDRRPPLVRSPTRAAGSTSTCRRSRNCCRSRRPARRCPRSRRPIPNVQPDAVPSVNARDGQRQSWPPFGAKGVLINMGVEETMLMSSTRTRAVPTIIRLTLIGCLLAACSASGLQSGKTAGAAGSSMGGGPAGGAPGLGGAGDRGGASGGTGGTRGGAGGIDAGAQPDAGGGTTACKPLGAHSATAVAALDPAMGQRRSVSVEPAEPAKSDESGRGAPVRVLQ